MSKLNTLKGGAAALALVFAANANAGVPGCDTEPTITWLGTAYEEVVFDPSADGLLRHVITADENINGQNDGLTYSIAIVDADEETPLSAFGAQACGVQQAGPDMISVVFQEDSETIAFNQPILGNINAGQPLEIQRLMELTDVNIQAGQPRLMTVAAASACSTDIVFVCFQLEGVNAGNYPVVITPGQFDFIFADDFEGQAQPTMKTADAEALSEFNTKHLGADLYRIDREDDGDGRMLSDEEVVEQTIQQGRVETIDLPELQTPQM